MGSVRYAGSRSITCPAWTGLGERPMGRQGVDPWTAGECDRGRMGWVRGWVL